MAASELFNRAGRVALVTGASSGLGERFAEVLAEVGAAVVLVARRADRLDAVAARIGKAGGKALAVAADVRDHDAMAGAFRPRARAFCTVDNLVHKGGGGDAHRAQELSETEWGGLPRTHPDPTPHCA